MMDLLAELHDVFGQELTLLALECDLVLAADPDGPSAPGLRRIRGRADGLLRSVAALAAGARPVSLRDCLERAGRDLLLAGIELRLDLPADLVRLPPEVDALLARVIREGVTNVVRHAPAATACDIGVRTTDGVVLVIRNDGVTGRSLPGAGITGLRDRAAALGAHLDVATSGDSFELRVRVPPGHPGPHATAVSVLGR
jgi:two-component system sensor histidine kinase DesK